jgi:hypothetical protein
MSGDVLRAMMVRAISGVTWVFSVGRSSSSRAQPSSKLGALKCFEPTGIVARRAAPLEALQRLGRLHLPGGREVQICSF